MTVRHAATAAAVLLLAAGTAAAQDSRDREIRDLREGQEKLLRRIDELERRQSSDHSDLENALGSMKGDSGKAMEGGLSWKDLTGAGTSKIKFYGFARLDLIRDDSRPNNTQVIAWVRSEDRTAPASIGARQDLPDLTIHPRLTRLGMDFDGPTIARLGDAKVTGKLEVDFYNNGLLGQAESRAALRMRHAWVKLGWTDFSLLAGQTNDVIAPLWPSVNPDLVMWGAGNLGDRRAQVRLEFQPKIGDSRLVLQGMLGQTGADDNADLDGNGYRDGEASAKPTIQLRAAWKSTVGEKKAPLEVGLWWHRAQDRTDTDLAGSDDSFESRGYGIDFTIPVWQDVLWVKGEAFRGQNLDDVRGGIFQGVNTATADEIDTKGGWLEAGWKTCPWHTLSIGRSVDDPENGDLPVAGRARDDIRYVGNKFSFDAVEIGFDCMLWTTHFIGSDKGNDRRIQISVTYRF